MAQKLYIAAGDWGGSNLRSAVIETDGTDARVIEETLVGFSSKDHTDPAFVIRESMGESVRRFGGAIDGVGLDVAGPVARHETLLAAPNIEALRSRTPFDLHRLLTEAFDRPAIVANDLEAALAGETAVGSLKGVDWAMLENIGTGWGGARLYAGVAVAAEPGHQWIPGREDDPVCGCGKAGCIEAVCSGGAIRRRVTELCAKEKIEIPEGTDACAFADGKVASGEIWAVDLYGQIADTIGQVWGSNLNVCPPMEKIAYMGSFLDRAMEIEFFRNRVRESLMRRTMFRSQHEGIPIVKVSAPHTKEGIALGPLYGVAKIFRQMIRK